MLNREHFRFAQLTDVHWGGRDARSCEFPDVDTGRLRRGISVCILVPMKVVKVRRVGNSNVVSIPREFEARGYAAGTSVLVEELEGGELRIMPTEQVRDRIRGIGRRVVAEHAEALQILAEHDPDDQSAKQ